MRSPAVGVAALAVGAIVAACSGSDPAPTDASSSETVPESVSTDDVTTSTAGVDDPVDVDPEAPASVRIDVSVAGVDAELTGLLAESDDPFGQFVSCSGLRASYVAYSVLASVPTGEVRAISVASGAQPVAGVDEAANVRVEFASSPPIDAGGTMTLSSDQRSGSFVAFDPGGNRIEGSFDCEGGDARPEPLAVGSDDGVLEAVEVVALLRSGDAQRILGLAAESSGAATAMMCPGAVEASGEALSAVSVEGDDSLGAISGFELAGGATPTLRLRVGATTYEFERVTLGGATQALSGTFTAEADGVSIDGAFRCS